MNFVSDIKELIGNTQLIKLTHICVKENVNIFAKLECFNPGGSVKDRIGVAMIEGPKRKD
ncbi:pyridoxal-phosphate dependent enzyme [Clostridium sp. C2-6-12]|uniref:pyridoxal-phosphate dependent enzyme n=1 Tax=Clostridium sp. C2-6-12 TaxID=2698832 RepID=UPI001FABA264|nr:pyridoxal-phosphate dependent enzyme [Clostridium sp. C2-6-12]